LELQPERGDSCFYHFDNVLAADSTQSDVWDLVKPLLVTAIHDKQGICLFAFGGQGSGKTYTLTGAHSELLFQEDSF